MSIADLFESGERKADRCHFRNMVMIAKADGEISEAEQKLLQKIGKKLSLTDEQQKELVRDAKSFHVSTPYNREERFEQIINLVMMVQADGKIADAEIKTLERVAVGIGFRNLDEVDVESILALINRGEGVEGIMDELLY